MTDPPFRNDLYLAALVDTNNGRILENPAAVRFDRSGFAQGQVHRVHMATLVVQQSAAVEVRVDVVAHALRGNQFETVVAGRIPVPHSLFEAAHLLRRPGRDDRPVFQVAFDVVLCDAVADDLGAFRQHGTDGNGGVLAVTLRDAVQIPVETVDDLPAIAPRSSPGNFGTFEYDNVVIVLCEMQRCRKSRKAGADDANIATRLTNQLGTLRRGICRGRVVGTGVLCLCHGQLLLR